MIKHKISCEQRYILKRYYGNERAKITANRLGLPLQRTYQLAYYLGLKFKTVEEILENANNKKVNNHGTRNKN